MRTEYLRDMHPLKSLMLLGHWVSITWVPLSSSVSWTHTRMPRQGPSLAIPRSPSSTQFPPFWQAQESQGWGRTGAESALRLNQISLKLSPRSSSSLHLYSIHLVEELCLKKILWSGKQEEGCCPLREPVPALPSAQPDRKYVGLSHRRKWAEAGCPLWFRVNSIWHLARPGEGGARSLP